MFCKVADKDLGAILAENLRVVAPSYAHDEAEAARPAHPSSGDGILYHDGLLRERPSVGAKRLLRCTQSCHAEGEG